MTIFLFVCQIIYSTWGHANSWCLYHKNKVSAKEWPNQLAQLLPVHKYPGENLAHQKVLENNSPIVQLRKAWEVSECLNELFWNLLDSSTLDTNKLV